MTLWYMVIGTLCVCHTYGRHCRYFLQISRYLKCQLCVTFHKSREELNTHYERDHPTQRSQQRLRGPHPNLTSEGKYKCDECEKTCNRVSDLYSHQRNMHGREPGPKRIRYQGDFPCDFCGKRLSSKPRLLYHMRSKHSLP